MEMRFTTILGKIQRFLDLCRADIDPEISAAAMLVRYLTLLLIHGGTTRGQPDDGEALDPSLLELFLERAVMTAQRTGRFVEE